MRLIQSAILLCLCLICFTGCASEPADVLTVAAPFGPLAYPLVYLDQNDPLIRLIVWQNPEQLRAMVAGNQADLYAVPSNVAALFYNRGGHLRLLDVSLWSVLWVVSADSTVTSFEDLRGRDVAVPFRGNMPHILFDILAEKSGLDIENDTSLRFVNTPLDAVNLMLTGSVDNAVLSEPDISVMMYRAEESSDIKRTFHRAIDFQEKWAESFGTAPEIPYGGIATGKNIDSADERIAHFTTAYAEALEMCRFHPREIAERVASYFGHIPAEAIESSLKRVQPHAVSARTAKKQLEDFFTVLYTANPVLIGGSLPDDGFYSGPDQTGH